MQFFSSTTFAAFFTCFLIVSVAFLQYQINRQLRYLYDLDRARGAVYLGGYQSDSAFLVRKKQNMATKGLPDFGVNCEGIDVKTLDLVNKTVDAT
ncbi:hypothetical protein TcWFU_001979 [Taenia crassiceps]|uniref:Uncharacterized protein n=1 Tax=Taenia crassiceps TaxID=6207 RepID=A0ABR4QPV4_9CEST